jgi:predicted phosphoadenosine phosphosulfate sulfurtransferase
MGPVGKIVKWIADWKGKGYPDDIPDTVPHQLMKLGLAPSYQAIALAILKNDMNMESLGFTPKKSEWYSAIKRVEIAARIKKEPT